MLITSTLFVQAQSEVSVESGEQAYRQQDFAQGVSVYEQLQEQGDRSPDIQLQLGWGYYKLHDFVSAFNQYTAVLGKQDPQSFEGNAEHVFHFAELLLMRQETDQALRWYQAYQQRQPQDTRARRKIWGIQQYANLSQPAAFEISSLDINTSAAEFSPAFYANGLVFVSNQTVAAKSDKKSEASVPYFDLYFAKADGNSFRRPIALDARLNSPLHEGSVVFFDHDRQLILTRNIPKRKKSPDEKVVLHLQLFTSSWDSVNRSWREPAQLSWGTEEYSYGHPALNESASRLYYVSNRPGGYGGTDLYYSERKGNEWGEPKNLGPRINTEGNEMFPYVAPDSSLYFSSDGHAGFGGLDIYQFTVTKDSVFNLLNPINGPDDDFALVLRDSLGYFSSNRRRVDGKPNDDVYKVVRVKTPPAPPAVVQGDIPETPIVVMDSLNPADTIYYTVQILALRNPRTVSLKFLQDLKGVTKHYGKDGLHRYTYGVYDTLEEAVKVLDQIRGRGYLDAFVRVEKKYAEMSWRGEKIR